jgi:hypothetical protein
LVASREHFKSIYQPFLTTLILTEILFSNPFLQQSQATEDLTKPRLATNKRLETSIKLT